MLYRAFSKSYMLRELIVRGKNGNLFEHNCVLACDGFQPLIPSPEAEAQVVMMKYLSQRLKALGSSFVFVIAPSKVTMYREEIPDQYSRKIKNGEIRPTNYDVLVPLLQRYHVPYVDGREITLINKDTFPVRAFPKTGIHWSRAVAFFTTVSLLKMIGQESGHETAAIIGVDRKHRSSPGLYGRRPIQPAQPHRAAQPTVYSPELSDSSGLAKTYWYFDCRGKQFHFGSAEDF